MDRFKWIIASWAGRAVLGLMIGLIVTPFLVVISALRDALSVAQLEILAVGLVALTAIAASVALDIAYRHFLSEGGRRLREFFDAFDERVTGTHALVALGHLAEVEAGSTNHHTYGPCLRNLKVAAELGELGPMEGGTPDNVNARCNFRAARAYYVRIGKWKENVTRKASKSGRSAQAQTP